MQKKRVTHNKTLRAYLIENENDLDEFLAEEVRDFDMISKREGKYKISFGGNTLFSFEMGSWVVVFSDLLIRSFNNEEFLSEFNVLD